MLKTSPSFPSLIELQFRRAKGICRRNVPVEQTGRQKATKTKSSAQVETFVKRAVQQKSCGLKPDKSKASHIGIRLLPHERHIVVQRAGKCGLTISQYVRLTLLKLPGLDPERNKLLRLVHYELNRQGTNLNQIARQLNADILTSEQGSATLDALARSLHEAHRAVREALANGRSMD